MHEPMKKIPECFFRSLPGKDAETGAPKSPFVCGRRRKRAESGAALLPVLCLIFSASLLVMGMLAMSQYSAWTSASQTGLQHSMYLLEGAANRIQWLVSAERNQHPSIRFDSFDYSDDSYDHYLPDGLPHSIDYYGTTLRFTLHDTAGGLDFSSSSWQRTLQRLKLHSETDSEFIDSLDRLSAILSDYSDSNDDTRTDGREITEYEQSAMEPLPRNSAWLWREELFYIPEFTALFPPDRYGRLSSIRLIPPENVLNTIASLASTVVSTEGNSPGGGGNSGGGGRGSRQSSNNSLRMNGNPSIFNAPDIYFKSVCGLEDSEIESVRAALKAYRTDRTPLNSSLDTLLLGKLSSGLTWQPGRLYTALVEMAGEENRVGYRLVFSFAAAGVEGVEDDLVRYLEWMFF